MEKIEKATEAPGFEAIASEEATRVTDQHAVVSTADITVSLATTIAPRKPPRIRRLNNPPISKIEDGLYLGDIHSSYTPTILKEHKISSVVSLIVGDLGVWNTKWSKALVPEGRHLYIPTEDNMTHDILVDMARICDHVDNCRYRQQPSGSDTDTPTGNVLVHCAQGISRSATAVVAYLMRTYKWTFVEALAFVKERRRVYPNKNFQEQLRVWEAVGYNIWVDEEKKVPKSEYAIFLEGRAVRLEEEAGKTGNEVIGIINWEELERKEREYYNKKGIELRPPEIIP
ncbi:hypothetical protein H072_9788 [Dactylellina haptotyla CBS 200.50]|uniref:protein-tyrosine-phosphatase n=1 Tax=Dactylellina haptotyla (strain CBS 200.50) TaxID=1284197 RepID=S8BBU6_DACHA|nr:hypothetical protein H072_9788 [Dactylellina haptotyla CBS 200.50]